LLRFQDQTNSFGNFLDSQQSEAQCELWQSQGKDIKYANNCGLATEDSSSSSGGNIDCSEVQNPNLYDKCS